MFCTMFCCRSMLVTRRRQRGLPTRLRKVLLFLLEMYIRCFARDHLVYWAHSPCEATTERCFGHTTRVLQNLPASEAATERDFGNHRVLE